MCTTITFAQAKAEISPRLFTAEDKITITVNVAGSPLDGIDPLYIWAWVPGCCGANNGDWTNSNEANKMTKVSANVWSFSYTPTTFYGKTPAEIGEIGRASHVRARRRSAPQGAPHAALAATSASFGHRAPR